MSTPFPYDTYLPLSISVRNQVGSFLRRRRRFRKPVRMPESAVNETAQRPTQVGRSLEPVTTKQVNQDSL